MVGRGRQSVPGSSTASEIQMNKIIPPGPGQGSSGLDGAHFRSLMSQFLKHENMLHSHQQRWQTELLLYEQSFEEILR